jgi:hypothetical protein
LSRRRRSLRYGGCADGVGFRDDRARGSEIHTIASLREKGRKKGRVGITRSRSSGDDNDDSARAPLHATASCSSSLEL